MGGHLDATSGGAEMIDLIMDTFRLNEFGNFVYAKDITSSGAIRKKEGAIVNFKTDSNGVKGLRFRKSNKRYWISAGAAAFVIAYGRYCLLFSLPCHLNSVRYLLWTTPCNAVKQLEKAD